MKPTGRPRSAREVPAKLDREETLVCMVLAFCIAGASIDVVYKVLG
jgi:hypothetical protein